MIKLIKEKKIYNLVMTTNIYFDNKISFEENNFEEENITIFSERRGRKTNTYILGWKISKKK